MSVTEITSSFPKRLIFTATTSPGERLPIISCISEVVFTGISSIAKITSLFCKFDFDAAPFSIISSIYTPVCTCNFFSSANFESTSRIETPKNPRCTMPYVFKSYITLLTIFEGTANPYPEYEPVGLAIAVFIPTKSP